MIITTSKNALLAFTAQDKASSAGEQVEKCFPTNDTMEMGKKQEKSITDYLLKGKENAKPAEVLAQEIGCASVRHLQRLIHNERERGALILSARSGGFYLPRDNGVQGREEIQEYIRSLQSQALNTLSVIRSAKRALRETEGQTRIDL